MCCSSGEVPAVVLIEVCVSVTGLEQQVAAAVVVVMAVAEQLEARRCAVSQTRLAGDLFKLTTTKRTP